MNDMLITIYIIFLIILFFISAFCSSADITYGSLNIVRIESHLKENENDRRAKYSLDLLNNYDNTISSILFLNDLANIGNETISALLGYMVFTDFGMNGETGAFIFSLVDFILILIFGEILPKSISKLYVFRLGLIYSPIVKFLTILCTPINFVARKFSNFIVKSTKIDQDENEVLHEELEEIVDTIEEEGIVDEDNAEIIRGAIDYAETEAYEIMTPRVDLKAIDIDDDIEDYLQDEDLLAHTRIPIYQDTIDNIIGFVNIQDLIKAKLANKKIDLKSMLREPLRFPRSTEINDILKAFKENKIHFAIINDEYGGVEGVVTMEDIVEEIVGEIWDENDDKEELIDETKDENSFIIDGSLNLEDFCDFFDIDKDEIDTEYVTIGGYCIELLDDRFAKIGDIIAFKNLIIEVLAVDENNTIEKLKVTKNPIED